MTPFELLESQLGKAGGKETFEAMSKEMNKYLDLVEEEKRLDFALSLLANLTVQEVINRVKHLSGDTHVSAYALLRFSGCTTEILTICIEWAMSAYIRDNANKD